MCRFLVRRVIFYKPVRHALCFSILLKRAILSIFLRAKIQIHALRITPSRHSFRDWSKRVVVRQKYEGEYVSISREWFAGTILISCNSYRLLTCAGESARIGEKRRVSEWNRQHLSINTWTNNSKMIGTFLDILLFFLFRQSFKNTGKTIEFKWQKI